MFNFSVISSQLYLYTGFVLLVLGMNLLLRNTIPPKAKKKILDNTFIFSIIIFTTGFFLPGEVLPQAAFTFSSVYFGFWLSEQIRTLEDRRKSRFFLGLVWQELRYNRHQIESIKNNFKFFLDDPRFLIINFDHFSSVTAMTKHLKTQIYDSYISSGVITALRKDLVFNSLEIAYNDIKYLEAFLQPIREDFETKLKIHTGYYEKINKNPYEKQMLEDLQKKMTQAGAEVATAYRTVCIAIDVVNGYLNTMGVKTDEETLRQDVLTKEDKIFIKSVLRKLPEGHIENPFNVD